MAKIKQSPKMPAEHRREQLLESAQKLFTERGYRGTSTEEIAANAGLTKGALYFHFKSKEDILLSLIKFMSNKFQVALQALPTPLTPWQVIEAVVCHTQATNPREFRSIMDIWVQAMRVPRIRKFIREEHEQRIAYVAEHLDPGFKLSKPELKQMVVLSFAMCDGIAGRRVFNKASMDIATQMKLVRTMFQSLYNKGK
jgi:AcrR family transcriptional regulator